MLNMEYLMEEAKIIGLPPGKKRAIIREYLQTVILDTIYRSEYGRVMFFCGGTALRFYHNLPRFSEDLDFNTKRMSEKDFEDLLGKVGKALSLEGFNTTAQKKRRDTLMTANIEFTEIMSQYGITDDRGATMTVKVEVNNPPWPTETESHVTSKFGYNFTAILMSNPGLITEKLCAMLSRKRGRDIYDILHMLRRRFPFDEDILEANNIQNPKERILRHFRGLDEKELNRLAQQVRPFLFKEDDIELILKAREYAEKYLNEYPQKDN
ncbi:MAG: nucleotidyl transferase AbiEii/AbiGii toxin family protein [Candidatus Altiarchaeota archaeon]